MIYAQRLKKRNPLRDASYFVIMAARKAAGKYSACPNCGFESSDPLDKKYVIFELRRCRACHLLFRSPTDRAGEGDKFYESQYEEVFTTTLPAPEDLQNLTATSFSSTESDYEKYIRVLDRLGVTVGSLVYDYGCSWGYGSFQLGKRGYRVEAYEIAKHRREFARDSLGVSVDDTFPPKRNGFLDCFLAAHVLEHVPSVEDIVTSAMRLLKPGGLLVSFTPNGSMALRKRWPLLWRQMWGRSHPNFLDDVYWRHRLKGADYVITSDIDGDEKIDQFGAIGGQLVGRLNEWELLVAMRKTFPG